MVGSARPRARERYQSFGVGPREARHSDNGRVHPPLLCPARRGIGTLLLERCEDEARARGFCEVELMATLPGVKLYAVRGYVGAEMVRYEVGEGESIEFIPMRKSLAFRTGDGAGIKA